jgi:acyl carrier protein
MTEEEITRELRPLIAEVTGTRPEEIRPESVLVEELGADSIDLLDLSFLVEEKFGITIEPNEFEKKVRARIPGGIYEKDGVLTAEALEELRKLLPELDDGRLGPGLRKVDIPSRLTVSVFVHVIQRKLAEKISSGGSATA